LSQIVNQRSPIAAQSRAVSHNALGIESDDIIRHIGCKDTKLFATLNKLKLLSIGKTQIYLAFHSLICNFARK